MGDGDAASQKTAGEDMVSYHENGARHDGSWRRRRMDARRGVGGEEKQSAKRCDLKAARIRRWQHVRSGTRWDRPVIG
jgi:hypothetical protein